MITNTHTFGWNGKQHPKFNGRNDKRYPRYGAQIFAEFTNTQILADFTNTQILAEISGIHNIC